MLQWNMAQACQVNSNHFEWLMFHSTMIIEERINLSETFPINNSLHPGGLPFKDFFFVTRREIFRKLKYDCRKPWHFRIIELSFLQWRRSQKKMPFKKTWSREIEKIASEKVPQVFRNPNFQHPHPAWTKDFPTVGFRKGSWSRYLQSPWSTLPLFQRLFLNLRSRFGLLKAVHSRCFCLRILRITQS